MSRSSTLGTADLRTIGGGYDEWDFKEQQLKGFRTFKVILKSLENVNNANPSWLDGFVCGPADKTTKSIYGNLLYIAPETIAGKDYIYLCI
ncbi:7464_t:CDS:2 [Rhizophagus irregularis]|nr:7464_t:CDS:2 [Rhizophagus irregularis]